MGTLHALSRRPQTPPEVYEPVNYRPTEICRTMMFDPSDGNHYEDLFDAVGVQYALGEEGPAGYYAVGDPEAPLIRWINIRPNGTVCVMERQSGNVCHILPRDEAKILGRIFQWMRPGDTDERWELIRGPAFSGTGESVSDDRPLYDALAK
jgi:hypothetical protein